MATTRAVAGTGTLFPAGLMPSVGLPIHALNSLAGPVAAAGVALDSAARTLLSRLTGAPIPLKSGQFVEDLRLNALYPREDDASVPFYTTNAGRRVFIDGKVREWSGEFKAVFSPVLVHRTDGSLTPHKVGDVAWMEEKDALQALQTAVTAYDNGNGEWPDMTPEERCASLTKFIEKLKTRRENLVQLLVWEIGKPRAEAEAEFDRTVEYMEKSIVEVLKAENQADVIESDGGKIRKMYRGTKPRGVTLCVGPFNYPWNEAFGTSVFPALLMGNTVICKTPKNGQLLLSEIADIFEETLPVGVFSVISGDGRTILPPIMKSGLVNTFHFIGGEKAFKSIMSHAPNRDEIHVITGLGAKNPAVVLPGANLAETAKTIVKGALSYNGQRCTAIKSVHVSRADAPELGRLISEEVSKLTMASPHLAGAKLTALAEEGKVGWLKEFIEDALSLGAEILNDFGGAHNATMMVPAVLYGVTSAMRIASEEQFGPIIPIQIYDDLSAVVDQLEKLPYRQQAVVFGDPAAPDMLDTIGRLTALNQRTNVNDTPQRGPDAWEFGAMDEVLLSITDALREFSIALNPRQVVLADNPANRAHLERWSFRDLFRRERATRKGASSDAGATG